MNKNVIIGIVSLFILCIVTLSYFTFFRNSTPEVLAYINTQYSFQVNYPSRLHPAESTFKYHANTEKIIIFENTADPEYDPEIFPALQIEITTSAPSNESTKLKNNLTVSGTIPATRVQVTSDEGDVTEQVRFQAKGKYFTISTSGKAEDLPAFEQAINSFQIK